MYLLSSYPKYLLDRSKNLEKYVLIYIHGDNRNVFSVAPIAAGDYWRSPFTALCDSKHLVEYIVCEVNLLDSNSKPHVYGKESQKVTYKLIYHCFSTSFYE